VPEPGSRIAEARRRAADAKQAAVALAAAGFLAVALLAKASHPAHAHTTSGGQSASQSTTQQSSGNSFDFGSGSVEPSDGSQPGVQSSVS
jgi:hypothetical protein